MEATDEVPGPPVGPLMALDRRLATAAKVSKRLAADAASEKVVIMNVAQ